MYLATDLTNRLEPPRKVYKVGIDGLHELSGMKETWAFDTCSFGWSEPITAEGTRAKAFVGQHFLIEANGKTFDMVVVSVVDDRRWTAITLSAWNERYGGKK